MSEQEDVVSFLDHLGLEADVLHDDVSGKLFSIRTAAYEANRRQVDAWFTFVRQIGEHSFFKVRMRGTGKTV